MAEAHEELQYLGLVRQILRDGEHRPDRQAAPAAPPPPLTDG